MASLLPRCISLRPKHTPAQSSTFNPFKHNESNTLYQNAFPFDTFRVLAKPLALYSLNTSTGISIRTIRLPYAL